MPKKNKYNLGPSYDDKFADMEARKETDDEPETVDEPTEVVTESPDIELPPLPTTEPEVPGGLQAPFQARGRHVVDFHMRRVASCSGVPGVVEADTMANMIAAALNLSSSV